jgi:hypothetical protein
VGSAKLGFSLNPDSFPRQFLDESDIDVVVVDEPAFDQVWLTMVRWLYPRRIGGRLSGAEKRWTHDRKENLFWGWFIPDEIRYEGLAFPSVLESLRDLSTSWFNAFQSLSEHPEFAARVVSGRLYRTWEHALLYHMDGLRQIKDIVQSMSEGS